MSLQLMLIPAGTVIDQSFHRVSFYFQHEEDAEKFYIAVSESLRLGIPLDWRPEASA